VPENALFSISSTVSISSSNHTSSEIQLDRQGAATPVSKIYSLRNDSPFGFLNPVSITVPYNTSTVLSSDELTAAYFDNDLKKWVAIESSAVIDD
jgi:hypothetical protein